MDKKIRELKIALFISKNTLLGLFNVVEDISFCSNGVVFEVEINIKIIYPKQKERAD